MVLPISFSFCSLSTQNACYYILVISYMFIQLFSFVFFTNLLPNLSVTFSSHFLARYSVSSMCGMWCTQQWHLNFCLFRFRWFILVWYANVMIGRNTLLYILIFFWTFMCLFFQNTFLKEPSIIAALYTFLLFLLLLMKQIIKLTNVRIIQYVITLINY